MEIRSLQHFKEAMSQFALFLLSSHTPTKSSKQLVGTVSETSRLVGWLERKQTWCLPVTRTDQNSKCYVCYVQEDCTALQPEPT